MAFSKAHRYSADEYFFSRLAHAIAHPSRLKVLLALHEIEEVPAGDLVAGHPISQQSVSQHLKILREAGVIRCRQQFPSVMYRLNEELNPEAAKVIRKFLKVYRSIEGKIPGGSMFPVNVEITLIEGI